MADMRETIDVRGETVDVKRQTYGVQYFGLTNTLISGKLVIAFPPVSHLSSP
jgi:hypothetical protein